MEIIEQKNGLVLEAIEHFDAAQTFECGQAFRWNHDGQGYVGVVRDKVIRVMDMEGALMLQNASLEDFAALWRHYLDLDRDYGLIKKALAEDPIIAKAIQYGWGIRLLNQDPWETLISFIISSNNGILRIKRIINNLSHRYGQRLQWEGRDYFAFPTPSSLAQAPLGELLACGCGYRAKYIRDTAAMVAEGVVDIENLRDQTYEEGFKTLQQCMGVGPKVADCILLFSLEKGQAFPVDVWIKRIMEHFYFKCAVPPKRIKEFAAQRFGEHAGLAQQYLFYYAREEKIGRSPQDKI